MRNYFVDLHIHIGRTVSGKPVKITGAKTLTLKRILEESLNIKGMDIVGVIDCHVPEILDEIEEMVETGVMIELEDGGLRFNKITLLLGAEIEVYDERCKGPIHVLAFLPNLSMMRTFSEWLQSRMKNITLSSQRIYEGGIILQEKVNELKGIFIPAHVFTPYKSLYGKGVHKSLTEVFTPELIDGIELGLSADSTMADGIEELHRYTFVSNSDAHSLPKIGREYQSIRLGAPTFEELRLALREKGGRKVVTNYGLDPKLGKYHRTTCEKCVYLLEDYNIEVCPRCGSRKIIKGVLERLQELENNSADQKERPPYIHQVPLEFIPKLGPKTLMKLRSEFGTEMNIIHNVSKRELADVVSPTIVHAILSARQGNLKLRSGGGGKYGKVETQK